MVSVDSEAVTKQLIVELLTPLYYGEHFALDVCFVSTSVSALLANATGLLSCRSAAPRPFNEASTCRVISSFGLK